MRKRYRYYYLIYHKTAVVALSPLICHWVNAHFRNVTWSCTLWILYKQNLFACVTQILCLTPAPSLNQSSISFSERNYRKQVQLE